MRIAVVTDDTPSIAIRWEDIGKYRRRHMFIFPSDEVFDRILAEEEISLPLRRLLHGRFIEVESFTKELDKQFTVDLYILSSRLGITPGDKIVAVKRYLEMDESIDPFTELEDFLRKVSSSHTHLLVLLPSDKLAKIIRLRPLVKELTSFSSSIVIGGIRIRELLSTHIQAGNLVVLPKLGIVRIGRVNREKIMKLLTSSELHESTPPF